MKAIKKLFKAVFLGVKNMKIKLILFSLLPFVLAGCVNGKTNDNDIMASVNDNIIVFVDEEEQFKKSDFVCIATYNRKAHTEIDDSITYTIYYINVLKVLKGSCEETYIYLRGDTTDNSSASSSVDESMKDGEKYKLYLKKRNNKYFTTAGYQSIIIQ